MKRIMILAISAMLVANVCAQDPTQKDSTAKQQTKEERVEQDIMRLTHELMLSDKQAEKFAVTFREFVAARDQIFEKNAKAPDAEARKKLSEKELDQLAKERFNGMKEWANLQSKYYDKFRKNLSARQVEKVLLLNEPFDPKPCPGKCHRHEQLRHEHPHHQQPRIVQPRQEESR